MKDVKNIINSLAVECINREAGAVKEIRQQALHIINACIEITDAENERTENMAIDRMSNAMRIMADQFQELKFLHGGKTALLCVMKEGQL